MLKVARHYYDRNIKTKKGEHNNNTAAGAMILIARYARIPNLRVYYLLCAVVTLINYY